MRVLRNAKQIFMAGWIIAVAANAETETWYQKIACGPFDAFRGGSEVVFEDCLLFLHEGLSTSDLKSFESIPEVLPDCETCLWCYPESNCVKTAVDWHDRLWVFGQVDREISTAWSSADGINWTHVGSPPDSDPWMYDWREGPVFENVGYEVLAFKDKLWQLGGRLFVEREGEIEGAELTENYGWVRTSNDGLDWSWPPLAPQWSDRAWHGAVVFNGAMWVLGGDAGQTYLNDVWASTDGDHWEQKTSAAPWSPRAHHGCVVHDGKIWVLGGEGADGIALSDVWYSSDGINWTMQTGAAPWGPRAKLGAVSYQDELLVIGGGYYPYRDIWAYGTNPPAPETRHSADSDDDNQFSLSEVLRVIQLYNSGGVSCACDTEDNFVPGAGMTACTHHASDYNPQDWRIQLTELLRAIQFYNAGGYTHCPDANTEDGFCPNPPL